MDVAKYFNYFLLQFFLIPVSIVQVNFGQKVGDAYWLNVNEIGLPIDNKGIIADVNMLPLGWGGVFDSLNFLFASGFMVSGIEDSILWTSGTSTVCVIYHFSPGTYDINSSDPRSVLYKVRNDDPPFGLSWQDWIEAVELGADFYDGDEDSIYNPVDINGNNQWDPDEDKPDILGDETLWCAYNDSEPFRPSIGWETTPNGIEIKQTVFAYEDIQSPFSNVIFVRYRLINNGSVNDTLKNIIFGVYPDTDLGSDFHDDYGSTDTLRNSIVIYNDSTDEQGYGSNPPAFLLGMLNGPHEYIPGVSFNDINGNGKYDEGIDVPLDTAVTYRGELGIRMQPGATNLDISAAVHYTRANPNESEPRDSLHARNLMKGERKIGGYVDPCTYIYGDVRGNVNCSEVNPAFWYSGDPVTDVGWIHVLVGDIRSIMSTGTISLVKNEPVDILFGYIVGRGTDNLNSIVVVRSYLDEIQNFVNNNLGYPIVSVKDVNSNLINYFLAQNYPNPFNPETVINYQIPQQGFVTLKIFDVLGKEVATLINEEKQAGSYEIDFSAKGLASGVYIYRMMVNDFIASKKMVLLR